MKWNASCAVRICAWNIESSIVWASPMRGSPVDTAAAECAGRVGSVTRDVREEDSVRRNGVAAGRRDLLAANDSPPGGAAGGQR